MDEKKTNPQNSGRLQNSKQEWSCPLTVLGVFSDCLTDAWDGRSAPRGSGLYGNTAVWQWSLCGSISKSGFCLCPSPGSLEAPAWASMPHRHARKLCSGCVPPRWEATFTSSVVYLPNLAVSPPLLLLATKCPTPRERQAEPGSVSASGKDAPWACGLTDPALSQILRSLPTLLLS